MAKKNTNEQFSSDWEKAVAWAQTQGIGREAILPVYQYDANRVANGSYPMSGAERNRALLAAKNPNNVTPVPSDKPNPRSFLGNARSDLANIFTGLAPNHLIPNLFHTAEQAIVHPQTWIKPLAEVGAGITAGNEKELKQGLEGAGNSILGVAVPGVYVLSELASGGIGNVLSHPITSFLDLAPFAPAGRILSMAADSERVAAVATKLGMTPNDLMKASLPKMGAAFVLSRDITKFEKDPVTGIMVPVPRFPGLGNLTKGVLVDDKNQPLTVSGLFKLRGAQASGTLRTQLDLAGAVEDSKAMGLDGDLYTTGPLAEALTKLQNKPEQMRQFLDLAGADQPYAPGAMPSEIMANAEIDPEVRTAYDANSDATSMAKSRGAASGFLLPVRGPKIDLGNGKSTVYTDLFGLQGGADEMVSSSRKFMGSFQRMLEILAPFSETAKQLETRRQTGAPLQATLDSALTDLQKTVKENPISGVTPEQGGARLPINEQVKRLTAPDGVIARALEAVQDIDHIGGTGNPKPRDYNAAAELSQIALDSMNRYGWGQVKVGESGITHPGLSALKEALTQYHKWAQSMVDGNQKVIDAWIGTHDTANEAALRAKKLGPDPLKNKRFKDPVAAAHQRRLRQERTRQRWTIKKALGAAVRDYRDFESKWWNHPPDKWRSVLYDHMIDQMVSHQNLAHWTEELDDSLKARGHAQTAIDQLHADPKRLAEVIFHETNLAYKAGDAIPIVTDEEWMQIVHDANDHVNSLRNQGYDVNYVPVATSLDASIAGEGRYGAGVRYEAKVKELSSTKKRNMTEFVPERYDILLSVHKTVKEAIERDVTIEFADAHIAPAAMSATQVSDWARHAFPSEFATIDPARQNVEDWVANNVGRVLGVEKWDPTGHLGFSFPRWEGKAIYIPAGLAHAINALLGPQKHFPLDGAWDKGTDIFRTAILGLSPRYTAHIVFGGAFLAALRSDPRIVLKMGEAYRMVKHNEVPHRIRQGATERGKEVLAYPTLQGGLEAHAKASGADLGTHVKSETIDRHGWDKANPATWVKAAAEVNFKFTNFVSSMYRAAVYLDGASKAGRTTFYDDAGREITMTPERAKAEGVKHALKVMGDLKSMTPLERSVFTRIMPFYGWTRHILQYVLTYPVDHPYRAQVLTVMANLDSDSVAKALDTRIQFLFFLGSPDSQGNVKALDMRFLDPLRDTANYASLSGWIGALNPILEAPLAMIDPNLVYGSTSLYPNVTYNQLYGIETSATQGNALLTGAEQFVGQIGALDAALNISGQYRNLATRSPNQFAKTIFQALNIPFAQVQDLNLKQMAVKGQDARYNVAKTAAAQAWQQPGLGGSGIEKALSGFTSVPDPMNPDYEITPQQLQQIYNAALAAYPGRNPSDVVTAPPTPPGF